MASLQLPEPLQLRICQYHNFKQLYHDESALTALFGGLSDNLLTELKLYLVVFKPRFTQ